MFLLVEFDEIAPGKSAEEITSEEVKTFINRLVKKPTAGFDPRCIAGALKGLRMLMHIANPDTRVLHFASCFFERLEQIEYGEFMTQNPEKTTELLWDHLKPSMLREAMEAKLAYDKILEKDVKEFVKSIRKEAASYQTYAESPKSKSSRENPIRGQRDNDSSSKAAGKFGKKENLPVCLYPPHESKIIRHLLKDCRACPEGEKPGLIEKFKEAKAKRNERSVKRVELDGTGRETEECTVLFSATYAEKYRGTLLADIGSDINLIDKAMISKIQNSSAVLPIVTLPKPATYAPAVREGEDNVSMQIVCKGQTSFDVELHVRHVCTLMLRNVLWMITEQPPGAPILGRPTLEALGLNTKEFIAAAADRLHREINLLTVAQNDEQNGTIAGVFKEGENSQAIDQMLQRAVEQGASADLTQKLEGVVKEFSDVFCLRLGPSPPANVEPMRIELTGTKAPGRAKQRRYPPEKRVFLGRFVSKLEAYGFIKRTTDAEWVAAPLVVPKPPPANFRLTIDLRPVNAFTKPMTWPMPNLESEIGEMSESKFFASIEVPSGFWQLPLHEDSQKLHAFMTDTGVYIPTRTLQGGRNSAQNFQVKVGPCFEEMRNALKAWIDDFAIHTKTEEELVKMLQTFFRICRERNLKVSARKTDLFLKSLKWCGRIVSSDGVRYEPKHSAGLQNCSPPPNAGELCEYVHCISWMQNGIPNHAERVAPLRDVLERAYPKAGKRTKRSIQNIPLNAIGWAQVHNDAFKDLQDTLRENINLAHRNTSLSHCVFTDASHRFWASVVRNVMSTNLTSLSPSRSINRSHFSPESSPVRNSAGKHSKKKVLQFCKPSADRTTCCKLKQLYASSHTTGIFYLFSDRLSWILPSVVRK